jgi:uncharacterized protein DUF4058
MPYSDAYIDYLSRGPFQGRVDPWAEAVQYFHQIHGCIISNLLERLRVPLLKLGYIASRETSLQVLERSQPDMAIRQKPPVTAAGWDYVAAAEAVKMEPGILIEGDMPELEAVYIRRTDRMGELITLVEIVSPGNKDKPSDIADYQERRERFVHDKGINVVEVDLTRSIKRLVRDRMAQLYSYHIAIHLPSESRLIASEYGDGVHSFALPLRHEIIPIETQSVYDAAYQQASIAPQIEHQGDYTLSKLPFPTLLTETEKQQAIEQVEKWQTRLNALRSDDS